jgi:hypothetical protein
MKMKEAMIMQQKEGEKRMMKEEAVRMKLKDHRNI